MSVQEAIRSLEYYNDAEATLQHAFRAYASGVEAYRTERPVLSRSYETEINRREGDSRMRIACSLAHLAVEKDPTIFE